MYGVTCLAEGTLGSPHSNAFFSRNSKSALPACKNNNHHALAIEKSNRKLKVRQQWERQLPLSELQFQCQSSRIVCERAQQVNHPILCFGKIII